MSWLICSDIIFVLLSGSLGTSIFDTNAFLVGASGGVYALLAGHLANILLVSVVVPTKSDSEVIFCLQ